MQMESTTEAAIPATMSPELRIGLTFICFCFYFLCAMASFRYGPKPMRLEKGKWVTMKKPDHDMHYLEWVSIVHGVSCILIGGYISYYYGFRYNRKTLYSQYFMAANSFGYFMYDTIAEWYFGTFDLGMIAHHIASMAAIVFILFEQYGGCAMMTGLYYAEMSGPCFIFRCAFKRQNLESTRKYLYVVTLYSICYFFSRGVGYTTALYPIAGALKIPFYLKCIFIPSLLISYIWLILIISMLWKTLPNWSQNPKEIENSRWWISGRKFFNKYTKDSPWVYVTILFMAIVFCIMPLSYAYIANNVDPSWGYTEVYE